MIVYMRKSEKYEYLTHFLLFRVYTLKLKLLFCYFTPEHSNLDIINNYRHHHIINNKRNMT